MLTKLKNKYSSLPVQVRASLWFLITNFMQKAISVISTPIFTRLLTTEQYGEYNVFQSWLGIITVIVTLNISAGVFLQGMVKFEDDAKVYASTMQGLTLTLCSVWTVIYFIFRDFFNQLLNLSTAQMCYMLLLIWTTAVFYFWSTEQRVNNNYRLLVALTMVVMLAQPALGVVLVLALMILGGLVFLAIHVSESDTNFPNVYLNGIDVGGLTQAQTLEKLNAALPEGVTVRAEQNEKRGIRGTHIHVDIHGEEEGCEEEHHHLHHHHYYYHHHHQ